MASIVVTLVDPGAGGNGNAIAAAASTPVVQAKAHPRGGVLDLRVTSTKAYSYKVYGFTDAASTTLTDGTELAAVTDKAATTGNGDGVQVASDNYAGYAVVVTNADAADAANIGVDRIIRKV